MAGAGDIISSLWSVESISSKELNTDFFDRWTLGLQNSAEALKSAKISLIEKSNGRYAHPSFWAAHIIIGGGNASYLRNELQSSSNFELTALDGRPGFVSGRISGTEGSHLLSTVYSTEDGVLTTDFLMLDSNLTSSEPSNFGDYFGPNSRLFETNKGAYLLGSKVRPLEGAVVPFISKYGKGKGNKLAWEWSPEITNNVLVEVFDLVRFDDDKTLILMKSTGIAS